MPGSSLLRRASFGFVMPADGLGRGVRSYPKERIAPPERLNGCMSTLTVPFLGYTPAILSLCFEALPSLSVIGDYRETVSVTPTDARRSSFSAILPFPFSGRNEMFSPFHRTVSSPIASQSSRKQYGEISTRTNSTTPRALPILPPLQRTESDCQRNRSPRLVFPNL